MFCNYKEKDKRNNISTCRKQKFQHLQNNILYNKNEKVTQNVHEGFKLQVKEKNSLFESKGKVVAGILEEHGT